MDFRNRFVICTPLWLCVLKTYSLKWLMFLDMIWNTNKAMSLGLVLINVYVRLRIRAVCICIFVLNQYFSCWFNTRLYLPLAVVLKLNVFSDNVFYLEDFTTIVVFISKRARVLGPTFTCTNLYIYKQNENE